MALMRGKDGQVIKDKAGNCVTITTAGEQRRRDQREDKQRRQWELAVYNYEQRLKRSAGNQLQVLDKRLGVGVGARKERKRLLGRRTEEVSPKRVESGGKS